MASHLISPELLKRPSGYSRPYRNGRVRLDQSAEAMMPEDGPRVLLRPAPLPAPRQASRVTTASAQMRRVPASASSRRVIGATCRKRTTDAHT